MRSSKTFALNCLTAVSFWLGVAVIVLWVRSPSIFDRLSWTTASGRYWEVATIWGDLAVVRCEHFQRAQRVGYHTYRYNDHYPDRPEFEPVAGFTMWGEGFARWGRGFSHQAGAIRITGQLQKFALERWTIPLWLPAMVLMTLPAIRLIAWRRARARRFRYSSEISRGLSWRLFKALPTVLLATMLLIWWRSYWSMDQLFLMGSAKAAELSILRGQAEVSITNPADFVQFDHNLRFPAPVPAIIPYSDVLGCPSWDHTFRRTTRRYKNVGLQQVTLEPAPWDLARDDIGLVIDDDLDDGPTLETVEDHRLTVRFWFLTLLASIVPARQIYVSIRRRRRVREGFCLACGYDLRASTGRCPECGTLFAMQLSSVAAV